MFSVISQPASPGQIGRVVYISVSIEVVIHYKENHKTKPNKLYVIMMQIFGRNKLARKRNRRKS